MTVYYDPENPADAFLRKGEVSTGEGIMVVVLIALPILALLGLRQVRFGVKLDGRRGATRADTDASRQRKAVFRKTFTFRLGKKKNNEEKRL